MVDPVRLIYSLLFRNSSSQRYLYRNRRHLAEWVRAFIDDRIRCHVFACLFLVKKIQRTKGIIGTILCMVKHIYCRDSGTFFCREHTVHVADVFILVRRNISGLLLLESKRSTKDISCNHLPGGTSWHPIFL